MANKNTKECIIIGGGPAGLTAGLYASRAGLKSLLIERGIFGGQIVNSSLVENYPGFPGGISTRELIERFKKQVDDLGGKIEAEDVLKIIRHAQGYTVKTSNNSYETKCLVIASGAQPKMLGAAGEEKFIGRGVSYCGTCDGPLFKNKAVVVVGGGDRAIEEAIFLTNYANQVYLVHRREEFRAAKILVDKIKTNPKIKLVLNSVVGEIIGEKLVNAVKIKNVKSAEESRINCDGIFIFVGIAPNTNFTKNILERDEFGFIITDQSMHTSREGIFACGDCVKKSLYQVVSACGDGAVAVDSAHKYLIKL